MSTVPTTSQMKGLSVVSSAGLRDLACVAIRRRLNCYYLLFGCDDRRGMLGTSDFALAWIVQELLEAIPCACYKGGGKMVESRGHGELNPTAPCCTVGACVSGQLHLHLSVGPDPSRGQAAGSRYTNLMSFSRSVPIHLVPTLESPASFPHLALSRSLRPSTRNLPGPTRPSGALYIAGP
ncbi:hypothetical protein C0Q70_18675 [Pomacea canaliculata]|uniref:Uncharacterized protein n=1 Tax=Pomacea canaliculata TaxID=400727 RepID=A0A2T7NH65_POMCA|nr:hypothetical protein C0Q70_18675 [Pomacea canaliculata]